MSPASTPTRPRSRVASDYQHSAQRLVEVVAAFRRSLRRHGPRPVEFSELTASQLELVRLVRRSPGISIADAAQELRLAPNTISTLVRQLTDSGVLLRRSDESDRRVAKLELSRQMQRKVDDWQDRRTVALVEAIANLAPGDQRLLDDAVSILARLVAGLDEGELGQ